MLRCWLSERFGGRGDVAIALEVRTLGRLYVELMEERRAWQQRLHAQLFHQGVPPIRGLLTGEGRKALAEAELSSTGRQMADTALDAIDHLSGLVDPLRSQLRSIGWRNPGPRALMSHYGIGALLAAVIRAPGPWHKAAPGGRAYEMS